jgi:simple sugar transport system ATP-binding protein
MTDSATSQSQSQTPQLAMTGITKQYPGTLANDNVDLAGLPGEVHALLGENGAGKSTLVKIIYGVVKADAGEIRWQGSPVEIRSPSEARGLGIGMVFQHFNLFETLTVAENISLGLDDNHDIKKLTGEIAEISEHYGLPINPHRHIHALSVGERQRVEIIRCLVQHPKLLIMDEPTSVLTPQEVDKLFETLRKLSEEHCSILYISHKLDEIQALCDGATVLRHGKVTAHCKPKEETPKSLAEMMIGSELPVCHRTEPVKSEEICLEVNGLSVTSPDPHGTNLENVEVKVRKGEIFGIAGVSGNGQHELLAAINGETLASRADMIRVNGNDVARLGPTGRRQLGLAFVPGERLGRGAVPEMSLSDNALLTGYLSGFVQGGFVSYDKVRDFATKVRERFDVRSAGIHSEAKSLSGGNLQKFIIGREIMFDPQLLVLAHPTWGVDVGAATTIHQAVVDLAQGGTSVLIVSEDLDELFEICDRIAVIAEGRLSPSKRTMDTNVEEVGMWMSGQFEGAEGGEPAHVD